jgi:hypothetical protein
MDVQMRHAFTCIAPVIDDQSVSALQYSELRRDLFASEEHAPEKVRVRLSGLGNSWDAALWDNEDVNRRLWLDVVESDKISVLVDDICGDLARCDLFENSHGLCDVEKDFTVSSGNLRGFTGDCAAAGKFDDFIAQLCASAAPATGAA